MTFTEEATIVCFAVETKLVTPSEAIEWAYRVVEAMPKPPVWIIDLATEAFQYENDLTARLRENTASPGRRLQLQIIMAGQAVGRIALNEALSKLFRILVLDQDSASAEPEHNRLINALMNWDQLCAIEAASDDSEEEVRRIFREYLQDADELMGFLRPHPSSTANSMIQT